ncbi:MAG: AAA family ATPase [Planctomycetes bacterium]|nr:AAA family ATPase [Planctomycetota bacterium]
MGARIAAGQAPVSIDRLLRDLVAPAAYPHPVDRVEVVQTHISVVFLAGERVYKLKKPVDLGFVDYSTLDRRRACCEAEVALNRRLAPDVYLGVLPITARRGRLRLGGSPRAALEWAVVMRRLPDDRTLAALVEADRADADLLARLGARLAAFHLGARGGPEVARWARFDAVAGNCRDNVRDVRPLVGAAVSAAALDRVARLTELRLSELRPVIEARAGRARDGHGDLRLEHVHVPEDPAAPPLVIDCVEFNDALRAGDPASDVAFLAMELERAARPDLAHALTRAWQAAADDPGAAAVLPFYVAYRAMVRAKVDGFTARAAEVPDAQRARAVARARAHVLLALGALSPPAHRPALVLVTGLPGTGKSVLAGALARAADLVWVRADEVRKALGREAGVTSSRGGAWGEGLYAPGWSDRTYARCLHLAEWATFEGRRVVVDACFASEARRRAFLDAARAWGVPALVLHLEAPGEVARARLDARGPDPSDADRDTHDRMAATWEPFGAATARVVRRIAAGGAPPVEAALAAMREAGLAG